MFGIMKYLQGSIILAAIIYLVFCCLDCKEANKAIDKINEENSSNYHIKPLHRAPFAGLVIIIILLVIALVSPMTVRIIGD